MNENKKKLSDPELAGTAPSHIPLAFAGPSYPEVLPFTPSLGLSDFPVWLHRVVSTAGALI
jgi:hypothetical protein